MTFCFKSAKKIRVGGQFYIQQSMVELFLIQIKVDLGSEAIFFSLQNLVTFLIFFYEKIYFFRGFFLTEEYSHFFITNFGGTKHMPVFFSF